MVILYPSSIHPLSILYPSNRPSFPHLRDAKTYPKRTEHPDPWVSTMAGFNSSKSTKVEIYDPCPAISPILQNHTQNPTSPKSCNQTASVINLTPFIFSSPNSTEIPSNWGRCLRMQAEGVTLTPSSRGTDTPYSSDRRIISTVPARFEDVPVSRSG